MKLDVTSSAAEVAYFELENTVAVVIDVLRATTVITSAFENGAKLIYPTVEVEEARALAKALLASNPADKVLLAGERDALLIPGFDFSNSPLEFTRERVENAQVVMTTTNGTRALNAAFKADCTFVGCLRNARAVANAIKSYNNVILICSGTVNRVDISDCMAAGAIMHELEKLGVDIRLGDLARMCSDYFKLNSYEERIRVSVHGQRILGLGLEADMSYCCELNASDVVPVYDGEKIERQF